MTDKVKKTTKTPKDIKKFISSEGKKITDSTTRKEIMTLLYDKLNSFDPTDTPYSGLTDLSFEPKRQLPESQITAQAAYREVHDLLFIDGQARQNLATFGTTWMETQAVTLMTESLDKNAIDHDEYPSVSEIESRCVDMIAGLFHADNAADQPATGVSTVGSSEAVMLSALALKWRWREEGKKAGKDTSRPNLVLGTNVQVVWEKFCRYFDVEPKYVPIEPGRYVSDPQLLAQQVDENTIGVVGILGTTFTGEFEDIAGISQALDKLAASGGPDVPIHVDAASGGFIAPFLYPDLEWDFRVKRVVSINTSGHKYGLVYPGVGWAIWRAEEYLPRELVFDVNYLGGSLPTFTLNFSKSATQIIGQYYNLIRYGREGYTRIAAALKLITHYIAEELSHIPNITVISKLEALPLVAVVISEDANYTAYDLSHELRASGWQAPAYSLPDNAQSVTVLRMVIRAGFSTDLAINFVRDVKASAAHLEKVGSVHAADEKQFIH